MNPIDVDRSRVLLPEGVETIEVVIAKDQTDKYIPLPSLQVPNDGLVITQWEPNADELDAILRGQPIMIALYCGRTFPPLRIEVGGISFKP